MKVQRKIFKIEITEFELKSIIVSNEFKHKKQTNISTWQPE